MLTCAAKTCYDMRITGTLITGKGEGSTYIARPGYRRQFQRRFGMQPFPGTLNLKLQGENVERFRSLQNEPGIQLQSFTDNNQMFGAVSCFPCSVTDAVEGVVVIPARSTYDDVMEIVAEVCLRSLLGLKDGDKIAVEIRLEV